MKKKIVAFYGPQQSGKSEASKTLIQCGWTMLSFAEPIYAMVSTLLGTDARKLDKGTPLEALGGKTLRFALQTLGTEWGRGMIHQNIWLDHMRRRIEAAATDVVIDDLRFRNEYDLLHGMGAEIVRIVRPGYAFVDGHASEQDQITFTPTSYVQNDGSASFLRRNVKTRYHIPNHGLLRRPTGV